ncbi:Clavaminate synthase-like protein, partial [Exidia glandulosa HHB12029]
MANVLPADVNAPHYAPPPVTKAEIEWADLPTVDLSLISTEEGKAALTRTVDQAMKEHGFFYVVNHGLTPEQNARVFDIADVAFSGVSAEDKKAYEAKIKETGSYQGYKLREYWHINNGVRDQIEHYNVNKDATRREHPPALRPFMPEVAAFTRYNHEQILHPLLRLFARVVGVPEETFVKLHNFDEVGESWLRFMKYYPRSEEDERAAEQVWLKGHTDFGTVTILWSQPITALQILGRDKTWRFVKHVPNALVINVGDALEFLSGGLLTATIHRVVQPPPDQRGSARLGVFYFAMTDDTASLAPV